MRIINGKESRQLDAAGVAAWGETHSGITIDLGAGDGRFVLGLAASQPEQGAIAIMTCGAVVD